MKTRLLPFVLAALAGCIAAGIALQEGPREAGESALKDRDWAKAARLLTEALDRATERQDEILYSLATAQQNGGESDAAIATLDRLLKDHPASALRMKALYKKGDVLAAKKEFALAAQIYDAQVAAITAPERRKRLAMIYVEAGREFLTAKDPKDPAFIADYAAAHRLLSKSLELEALGADEEAVRADAIVCELEGKFPPQKLLASCDAFQAKFAASARMDEVLFARGSALQNLGRPWEAEQSWTRIASAFPASKRAPEALLRASYLHVPETGLVRSVEELRRALPLLRKAAKDFAATEEGIRAAFLAAQALAAVEDLRDEARKEYLAFVEAHPKHERAPEALLRVARLWREDQDDAKTIATLEDFLKRFPDSALWPSVREEIATVRMARVERARARKDWAALRTLAQEFIDLHATDGRSAAAARLIGLAFREEKKFAEAVEAWMKVAAKYPGTEEGHEARYEAAELLAGDLEDFERALKELPKVGGSAAPKAAQLLQRLQNPALSVAGEKIFKTGEVPAVKVTARNVETIKFRLWSLDLKDYFEKKASTSGLQGLEVSVIAPDKEWEVAVKDFKRFKEFKIDAELPKKDSGAYVVTASSDRLESTTVVVVSDLALLARAGRKGASVVVQNMKTGERVAQPAVSTAADGKPLKAWTKETTVSRLSFLAEAPGGLAFRDVDVSSLPFPPEPVPGAVMFSDRAVYGVEDEVRLRIVIRDAVEGGYAVPKEKKYRLTALSAQGVPFFEEDLALSKSGTAASSFRLLRDMGGNVRVDVSELSKPQEKLIGSQTLLIGQAAQRTRRFEFLMDDAPVFEGDPVDVTVILRDAWGRPMPGRQVRLLLEGDADWKDRTTGADGTLSVALRETGRVAGGGMMWIHAQHEGAEGSFAVPVLARGVLLSFESSSRFHEPLPAGDAKTVAFTARRADESPVARAFQWKVLRTDEAGERSLVASGDVTTGAEGKGSFAFTAKAGGYHQVVVSMKDEDGLPVRAEGSLVVFDDKEEAKLRLLAAADEFESGLPFELQVLSRLEKGPAYVTVESDRIEQLLPVTLDKGRTTVRLAPPPSGTRGFSVCVMMMQGNAFHTETRSFRLKDPPLAVEPAKKEYRPGETATVSVTARPGSDVILLVTAQPKVLPDLSGFLPDRRGDYFISESSAALSFQGRTTQIDEQVAQAIDRLRALETNAAVRVMMPNEAPDVAKLATGGGGGRYGGRMGGRENLVARGGGAGVGERKGPGGVFAEAAPLFFGSVTTDAAGKAEFSFALPQGWGTYTITAVSLDGSNAAAMKTATLKARAPVTVVVRAPETAVEGEKSTVVCLLTNHGAKEQDVTLSFGGDAAVKVPARSTLEKTFDWTAAATAAFALDGVRQDLSCTLRSKAPSTFAETGGAFTAKAELAPDGQGPILVRYATGPAALLEGLGEDRDALTPASDAAARLISRIARHRYARTDATKRAVMEYQALRAAGLADAAKEDAAWPVLLYLAEAEAKSAEFDVKPDATLLKARFAQAVNDDVKSLMLFALSRGGEAEYGFIYRLWRSAEGLTPRAAASVALALRGAKKPDEAKAMASRLVKLVKEDHWEAVDAGTPDSSNTTYATTALAAFVLAEIDPAEPLLAKARAWLLARAPSTPSERAFLALAMQSTNDKSAVTGLAIDGRAVKGSGEIAVAKAVIDPTGGGTFYALARRATGKVPEAAAKVGVQRTNHWPVLVVEGVSVGRESVAAGTPPENPSMTKVAAGESFTMSYELTIPGPLTRYAVVELPRVTGLRVRPESLRVLILPQKESEVKRSWIVAAYADHAGSAAEIDVLPAGAEYRAGWSMTAAERLGAGRVRYGKKQWKEARETLAPLFEKGTLAEASVIEAARMLAYSAVELKESETVVRFFEVLKEKSPSEVVPFEKIRAVGLAYAATGEHERAMQVHSGTCDAYFLQEANVVGALDELGRTRRATEEMKRLLSEHPDSALNREMLYGLAVRLYSASRQAPLTPDKEKRKLTRGETLDECIAALERTLAWFPTDPDADRTALTLGSAYLEAGRHALAERTARASATRYPKSRHQDGFDYTVAFAEFGQRKFVEALVMCDRLEAFDYGPDANPGPAIMRDRAVLMKAQIFHAKGELDKALENYKKLKGTSPDAVRSAAFLEREAISVPDSTVAPLGRPAEIELEYAGVATAHVRAYKVDLAMLAIRRKGLADAASIEVAGIKPVFEKEFALVAPNSRRKEKQKLALDLKDPGAYVVGVKAGDFFASGLVLRSDLAMTVQEEAGGTVRVNVTNAAAGGFAEGVKVTIFGTGDQKILSDKTDLRGIWESHQVRGTAVVVAEKDGHVAMYRGQSVVGQSYRNAEVQTAAPAPQQSDANGKEDVLQEQLKQLNDESEKNYRGNQLRMQQGVEVERTQKK